MKTDSSISKSVLAILALGIALIAWLLWFGLRPPAQPQTVAATETNTHTAATATPFPATTAATVAAAARPAPKLDARTLPPVIPIPLIGVLIDAENGSWLRDKDYLQAPHQAREFGGITFLMDGMIQLQGQTSKEWKNRSYRTNIVVPITLTNFTVNGAEIIQRGTNVGSLHLLGGTRYGSSEATVCADLIWHYADGTTQRTPVQHLVHFRDWVRNPYEAPAHLPYAFSKVVWTVPQLSQPSHALRLYRCSFANPAPEKTVEQLEFASTMADPTLFIVGVTLDPLKPGERPDPSPDLEPTDATPPKPVRIFVQADDGQQLPESKLQYQLNQREGQKTFRTSGFVTADGFGAAIVNYPPEDLEQLSVTASHDGYGGRKMTWDLTTGDTIPQTYTLKLGSEVRIGGIIVDESEAPIEGAKISLYRFWSGNEDGPNRKGEQPDFSNLTVTSDAQGHWQAKGVPAQLLDHIGFEVKHPDYVGTSVTVGQNSTIEKQLRDGTHKIILKRGLDVSGLVLDENDVPISGATVFAGERYYRERQQMKTDQSGQFHFNRMTNGAMQFSVIAQGHSPAVKTVNVKLGMDPIVFRLGAGKVIRGIVQNANGEPLAGTRIELEDANGGIAQSYEFSMTSGRDGRFEWDGAPDNPVHFYFAHSGYEQKRQVLLKTDAENTVVLQKTRTIQGQVVDADTGKPITKFRIGIGRNPGNFGGSFYADYPGMRDFTDPNGQFTLQPDEEYDTYIDAVADDYAEASQTLPDAQNDTVQVTLKLKRSPALHGVVVSPSGQPLPGVSVALINTSSRGGGGLSLSGTKLNAYGQGSRVSVTDDQGQFVLASPPESGGMVLAVGEAGFACVPLDQVRSSSTIVLQPFGRIVGTLKIGSQPAANKGLIVTFNLPNLGSSWDAYKRDTDDQGNFTFENVPPGDVKIQRLIPNGPNSWSYSDATDVTVKSGETTQVSLGDNGAVLVGTIQFDNPPTNAEALNFEGNLSGAMPPTPAFQSAEEARAYYQTPEWQALMKQHKNYAIEMTGEGRFTVDDVAPGDYTLNISVRMGGQNPWQNPVLDVGILKVTVPDSFSPASPIDIGQVQLTPVSPPAAQQ